MRCGRVRGLHYIAGATGSDARVERESSNIHYGEHTYIHSDSGSDVDADTDADAISNTRNNTDTGNGARLGVRLRLRSRALEAGEAVEVESQKGLKEGNKGYQEDDDGGVSVTTTTTTTTEITGSGGVALNGEESGSGEKCYQAPYVRCGSIEENRELLTSWHPLIQLHVRKRICMNMNRVYVFMFRVRGLVLYTVTAVLYI